MSSPAILMGASAILMGASAGMDIFAGLMTSLAAGPQADILRSRGRMLRLEAEEDARRFRERAESFRSTQAVKFRKGGVKLQGSPLTILDETILTASENISAIRARGRAQEFDLRMKADAVRLRGRTALIGGFARGGPKLAGVFDAFGRTSGGGASG